MRNFYGFSVCYFTTIKVTNCFSSYRISAPKSFGIAVAIAWGIHLELLSFPIRRELNVTYRSLQRYLAPDGFLTQVAQINRGGEALQANGYRVISQFGMGLMAQLKAAIGA